MGRALSLSPLSDDPMPRNPTLIFVQIQARMWMAAAIQLCTFSRKVVLGSTRGPLAVLLSGSVFGGAWGDRYRGPCVLRCRRAVLGRDLYAGIF